MTAPTAPAAPGPRGHWLLGHVGPFRRGPLPFLASLARNHGDVSRFRLGPKPAHLFVHPDQVHEIMVERHEDFPKGSVWAGFRAVAGNGLIVSEGAYWRRQRKLIQPAFLHERLPGYVASMTRTIAEMLDRWEAPARSGEAFDLCPEILRMISLLSGRALFGADESGEADMTAGFMHDLHTALSGKIREAVPTPLFVPTRTNRRILGARRHFDRIADRIIAQHRQEGADRGDLLSALMRARDPDSGEAMNDEQLRDEVLTLFVAGHETSGRLLPFILDLLGRAPEAAERLRQEIDGVLQDRTPTYGDLPRLPYARMVFDEALRLYPPIYFIFREARVAGAVGGYHVPRGSLIFLSPYLTHRHPAFYPEPEAFRPERFEGGRRPAHRHAYFPFGAGPHGCIGPHFAALQVILSLCMILQRFHVRLAQAAPVEMDALMILAPRGGVPVTLRRREPKRPARSPA